MPVRPYSSSDQNERLDVRFAVKAEHENAIGRLCLSFCVTKRYHALNAPKHPRHFTDIAPATFLSSADGVLVLGFHGETNV